jgi:phosphoserine phosphatase
VLQLISTNGQGQIDTDHHIAKIRPSTDGFFDRSQKEVPVGTNFSHVPKLQDALELIDIDAGEQIISRIPVPQLMEHAGQVKAGAFDYDGTLTPTSQWKQVSARIPEELRAVDAANRDLYWSTPQDQDNGMDVSNPDWLLGHIDPRNRDIAEGAWIAETIRLYSEGGITRENLREIAAGIPPRDGAVELLRLFDPRVVISFGMEQIIQDWLMFMDLTGTPVGASRLTFGADNVVHGCHINLVASKTKAVAADRFRKLTGIQEHDLLVLGDSIVDAEMMQPGGLNLLIIPPDEADKKLEAFRNGHLAEMWDRLTAILLSNSLMPLVGLIEMAREDRS